MDDGERRRKRMVSGIVREIVREMVKEMVYYLIKTRSYG